jgi:hypothetical protein
VKDPAIDGGIAGEWIFKGIVCLVQTALMCFKMLTTVEHMVPYTSANSVIKLATFTFSVTILLCGYNTYRHNFRRRFISDVN